MNDLKELFAGTMGQLSPEKDIVASAKARAAAGSPKRKFSVKRVICAAAAVCGVLFCGVTAAAAAGLIDFEAVFGNRISVSDSELADSLVGTVSNFRYKVSDSDYKIEIKGVTGDDKSVIVIAEILRTDGTPAADFFENPLPPDETMLLTLSQVTKVSSNDSFGYSMHYRVGEEGNIELSMELYSGGNDGGGLDGSKITFKGENFYPANAYTKYKRQHEPDEAVQTEYVKEREPVSEPDTDSAVINLNDILALDLKWDFSFTYIQSEMSRQKKTADAPEDSFILNMEAYTFKPAEDHYFEVTAQPSHIEAGSTGGRIDYVYQDPGYEFSEPYVLGIDEKNNELYIIMNDGERVRTSFNGGSMHPDGSSFICSFDLAYWDEDDRQIFINTEDIKAISVNGTACELK